MNIGAGLYQVSYMFEIVEAYQINVLFGGNDIDIIQTPVGLIDILHGLV